MKNIIFLLFIPFFSFSQNINALFSEKGEIYFSFKYDTKNQLNELSEIISIDHKTNADLAFAYANQKEFTEFLKTEIEYKIIKKEPVIFTNNNKNNWNYYPTYQEYIDIMTAFADSFPSICRLHHLGTLNSGREILIVQISNNVGQKENEPSFLYTSSMHGDELAGVAISANLKAIA